MKGAASGVTTSAITADGFKKPAGSGLRMAKYGSNNPSAGSSTTAASTAKPTNHGQRTGRAPALSTGPSVKRQSLRAVHTATAMAASNPTTAMPPVLNTRPNSPAMSAAKIHAG